MVTELRKTDIPVVGDMPWGTHVCLFWESKQDLLDTLVPYFKAGLENNEFCIWVVSPPLTEQEAKDALRQAIHEFDSYLAHHSIEIVPYDEWYLQIGVFDPRRVIKGFEEKLNHALARGYAGLRGIGDEGWLTQEYWKDFTDYEQQLEARIHNQRMLILCAYPLAALSGIHLPQLSPFNDFAKDVENPSYPWLYTFIEPNYGDILNGTYEGGTSQHPLDGVAHGEALIKTVYEAIRKSPHWNRQIGAASPSSSSTTARVSIIMANLCIS